MDVTSKNHSISQAHVIEINVRSDITTSSQKCLSLQQRKCFKCEEEGCQINNLTLCEKVTLSILMNTLTRD